MVMELLVIAVIVGDVAALCMMVASFGAPLVTLIDLGVVFLNVVAATVAVKRRLSPAAFFLLVLLSPMIAWIFLRLIS